jgi:hypothetical protein
MFHLMIQTEDMAQLDKAFRYFASRVESFRRAVNSLVNDPFFALYWRLSRSLP